MESCLSLDVSPYAFHVLAKHLKVVEFLLAEI